MGEIKLIWKLIAWFIPGYCKDMATDAANRTLGMCIALMSLTDALSYACMHATLRFDTTVEFSLPAPISEGQLTTEEVQDLTALAEDPEASSNTIGKTVGPVD